MLKRSTPLLLLLAVSLSGSLSAQSEIIEQVLVNVNGDILTKSDFEQRQVAALRTRPYRSANAPKMSAPANCPRYPIAISQPI